MFNDVNVIENENKSKCLSKGYQIIQHNHKMKYGAAIIKE